MISVMIPTRKRVRMLDRILHSLWAMSSSEDAVEVLLRCDEDDQQTIDYLEGINRENHPNFQVLISPPREGYKSLPSYFNDMAAIAKGNLLMACNDDAIFRTKNWDKIVEGVAAHYEDGIFDIGVNTILRPDQFSFSIISRRWFDILGYIQDPRILAGDMFIKDTTDALGRSIYIPEVIVEHDKEGFGDDATYAEARKWMSEIIFNESGKLKDEYIMLHNKVVAEAIEKLKPHLNPSIKPTFAAKALCIGFKKIRPIISFKYVRITPDIENKPRLFIGRVIDTPKRPVGLYPRMLSWLDGKPLLKSVLIRTGIRFIVGKLESLLKSGRPGSKAVKNGP